MLEILILLFDFSYFDIEMLQHSSTYTIYTSFTFITDFSNTNISQFQELRSEYTLICYCNAYLYFGFS